MNRLLGLRRQLTCDPPRSCERNRGNVRLTDSRSRNGHVHIIYMILLVSGALLHSLQLEHHCRPGHLAGSFGYSLARFAGNKRAVALNIWLYIISDILTFALVRVRQRTAALSCIFRTYLGAHALQRELPQLSRSGDLNVLKWKLTELGAD
jgi:hypothetical protein